MVVGGVIHLRGNRVLAKFLNGVVIRDGHNEDEIVLFSDIDLLDALKQLLRNEQSLFADFSLHRFMKAYRLQQKEQGSK